MDPSRKIDNPPPNPRSAGHRRALSESFVRLPDDFLFDSDPDFNISDIDLPSLSDDNASGGNTTVPPAIPVEYGVRSDAMVTNHGGGTHLRSLSVDAGFFSGGAAPEKRARHRRNGCLDGEASLVQEESTGLSDYAKKAMSADKLAELALIDPKRAKRILANRQSAARSKDRKILYTGELERKVQTLQTEATTLSAQVTLLQRDTTGLTSENRELKLRLQAMEQQAHLRDALNDALKEEVQRLKMATGQIPNGNEGTFNRGFEHSIPPFYARLQQLPNHGGALQAQLLHISFNDHTAHDSMELI